MFIYVFLPFTLKPRESQIRDIREVSGDIWNFVFLTQLYHGTKHNIQRSRRALEGRQETVCQEINLRCLLPAHSEPPAAGTGRQGRCPGRRCAGSCEPQAGGRPQSEDGQGHSGGAQDDSPLWEQIRLVARSPD